MKNSSLERILMNDLEKQLASEFGIVFKDKSLLEMAFTHTSYANEHRLLKVSHNERLEFLGDAVLQLIISNYLFKIPFLNLWNHDLIDKAFNSLKISIQEQGTKKSLKQVP